MIAVATEKTCSNRQINSAGEMPDIEHLQQENSSLKQDLKQRIYCLECEIRSLKCDKNYYKSLHEKKKDKLEEQKKEIEQLKAKIRYLQQKLYGRKTEKKNTSEKSTTSTDQSSDNKQKRKRGQQPGVPGHGRRDYSHLPVVYEVSEVDEAVCPKCGCPYHQDESLGTEDTEVIEIEIEVYRRRIHRKRGKKTCQCDGVPCIITAPGPAKLFKKHKFSVSVWVNIFLEKYLYQRPINRYLDVLKDLDFDPPAGTIGDNLKKAAPLFEELYAEIIKKNLSEKYMHADETRWLVFTLIEGKQSHRWNMWVFATKNTVVYILDPTRSADVIKKHLDGSAVEILIVDRYSAYKSYADKREGIILAFCWTHVRRDFLDTAKSFEELHQWGNSWVEDIGKIFHLNNLRVAKRIGSEEFKKADKVLREALELMKQRLESELTVDKLHPEKKKRLNSIKNHWKGLLVFVDYPWIPMDNSEAERLVRILALGRKNYYGSMTEFSGHFTAMMLTVFQTLGRWNINRRKWLTWYLEACADNGSQAPPDVTGFLPWNMTDEQLSELQYPDTS
jgi:transposase